MFIQAVEYEIKQVLLQGHDRSRLNYQARVMFAQGSQARVSNRTQVTNQRIFSVPASPADWLKQLLTDWEPALKFGWLVPRLKSVNVDVEIHHHDTYYNVVPMPMGEHRRKVYMQKFQKHPDEITPEDWLDREPCTAEDIANARKSELEILGKETAWYMQF
jgi:hypothetical protein